MSHIQVQAEFCPSRSAPNFLTEQKAMFRIGSLINEPNTSLLTNNSRGAELKRTPNRAELSAKNSY